MLTHISRMTFATVVVTCSCSHPHPTASPSFQRKNITGVNDNFDITAPEVPTGARDQSRAVVAFFRRGALECTADNRFNITAKSTTSLCSGERFAGEPMLSKCTGFLLKKKEETVLVTAAHCFQEHREMYAVFGYRMDLGAAPTSFPASNVCLVNRDTHKIAHSQSEEKGDWMLFRLPCEPPPDVTPLTLSSHKPIPGEPLYVIHHPLGLPIKYAGNAKVRPEAKGARFLSNLDATVYSSGAPVFSGITQNVVGIINNSSDHSLEERGPCVVFYPTPERDSTGVLSTFAAVLEPFLR